MHHLRVEVERGREEDLRPGRHARHRFALFLGLDTVLVEIASRIERAIDTRGEHDALADRDGVDLAAANLQRGMLRALERGGRGEDEENLVHDY